MSEEQGKIFPFRAVCNVAIGATDVHYNHVDDVRELLEFLVGQELPSKEKMAKACQLCTPIILEQFPGFQQYARIYASLEQAMANGAAWSSQPVKDINTRLSGSYDALQGVYGAELAVSKPDPVPQMEPEAKLPERKVSESRELDVMRADLASMELDPKQVDYFRGLMALRFRPHEASDYLLRLLNVVQYRAVACPQMPLNEIFKSSVGPLDSHMKYSPIDSRMDKGMFDAMIAMMEGDLPSGAPRGSKLEHKPA